MHNLPDGVQITWWCGFCNGEPAEGDATIIEEGESIVLPIGLQCLQIAEAAGKIEEQDSPH